MSMTQHTPDTDSGSTTEQVKDQVGEQAQVAQAKARGAADQARSRLRDQVDQRSTQAGERLSGSAADVRGVAEELRRQGKDTPARMAEQAAGQADRMADYLKAASGERILRDVEDFARGNPWAVAAGGLALGFAASRFLKASSSRRYRATQAGDQEPPPRVGRHPVAEPAAEVPVAGTDDPAASTVTTPVPVGTVPTEPDLRAPRAQ
jgi:ElaB/YqjD/DUF883 family membrane-anchored ribosome-binding protein